MFVDSANLRFCHLTPLIFGSSPLAFFERRELELEKSFARNISHSQKMANFSESRNDKKKLSPIVLGLTHSGN
jgi:hypothetical protein